MAGARGTPESPPGADLQRSLGKLHDLEIAEELAERWGADAWARSLRARRERRAARLAERLPGRAWRRIDRGTSRSVRAPAG